MSEHNYPVATLQTAAAYMTAYLASDDSPDDEQVAAEAFAELAQHSPADLAIVFSAMLGAVLEQLAGAMGATTAETWSHHATAYAMAFMPGVGE